MNQSLKSSSRMGKGIYLLPNLFTTAGFFAGFFAIVAAFKGQYEAGAIAIYIAMIMDSLDGRVARLTNTQSAFGAEYDSMADMVSFGIAPALLVYTWALSDLGRFGWLASFIFAVTAALRLARFNTQVATADKKYFQGLASPAAAALVAGMIWIGTDYDIDGKNWDIGIGLVTIIAGILMVSNFRYYSFKEINWKGKVPFLALLVVVVIFVTVAQDPPMVLFVGFSIYALSGPILTLKQIKDVRYQRRGTGKELEKEDDPQGTMAQESSVNQGTGDGQKGEKHVEEVNRERYDG